MFSKKDFQQFGKQEPVLFASVTTRITGRKDDALLRTYGFGSFPSFAILDASGTAITKSVGRDLYSMKSAVRAAKAWVEVQAAEASGETIDRNKAFLAKLALGKLRLKQAKAELAGLSLTAEQAKAADESMLLLEMNSILAAARRDIDGSAQRVYEVFKSGRTLPEGSSARDRAAFLLMRAADKAGDGKAFQAGWKDAKPQLEERVHTIEKAAADPKLNKRRRASLGPMLERLKGEIAKNDKRAAELAGKSPAQEPSK
ncbi:MAG: hypothetical protein KDC87_06085 [Planctomycetes bacterium]|nr:hypothetical protein [Planctomycetota bacterium]